MSVCYTYQNLMLHNCYSNNCQQIVTMVMLCLIGPQVKLFNQDQYSQNSAIPQCSPSPLLRRKISSLLPTMVFLFARFPPKLVLEDLLHPGYSRISFLIHLSLLLDIPLSFLLTLSSISSLKLPLERLLMLFKPLNISIPLSPVQSPQRQSEESLGRTHSRLW